MTSETERAWAAGFFDGEGCVTMNGKYPRVIVAQVETETLERFQAAVGGVGSICGPYRRGRVDGYARKPICQFQVTKSADVIKVFHALEPYLGTIKRDAFLAALITTL